jgi:CrcB protein
MTPVLLIGVALLGGVGAVGRFLLDLSISSATGRAFPYGTLGVNLLGALVLGGFLGAGLHGDADELLGTGLVGAFTTFSTWMLESQRLEEDRQSGLGAANLAISLLLGLAGAWVGRQLGAAL